MALTKIYTKTGDKGETSLLGGKRVLKSDSQIDTYGEVDHLNSLVGALISSMEGIQNKIDTSYLIEVQNNLFSIGSYLACEIGKEETFKIQKVSDITVDKIEAEIDKVEADLSDLKNFILPGGTLSSSFAHLCRTQARKVERLLIKNNYHNGHHQNLIIYINRLSDYFFVYSRLINKKTGIDEIIWKG